jgi:hypothetical protein
MGADAPMPGFITRRFFVKLSEVTSISSGLASVKRYQPENKILESWRILRSIHNGRPEIGEISLALPEKIAERIMIRPSDLLVTTKFNGRCPIYRVYESHHSSTLAGQMVLVVRSGNSLLTEMFRAFLDSAEGQNRLNSIAQDMAITLLRTIGFPITIVWRIATICIFPLQR